MVYHHDASLIENSNSKTKGHVNWTLEIVHSLLAVFCIAVSCLQHLACKDPPPEPPKPHAKDPRTYTWTIDTLAYPNSPQTLMMSIWGNSPQDIWAVGHNANFFANIYHYDGTRWSHFPAISAMPYSISYRWVTGFSSTNVYAVGVRGYLNPRPGINFEDSSLVVHYDGTRWRVIPTPPGRELLRIWGSGPSNIWAGGDQGTLFHYDGVEWIKERFDTTQHIGPIFGFGSEQLYSISTFYDVFNNPDTAYYFFNEFSGSEWRVRNSMKVTNDRYAYGFGHIGLWGADPSNLYSINSNVYKSNGNLWSSLFGGTYLLNDVRGTAANNIFAVGDHGTIYHYDGSNWNGIPNYRNTIVRFLGVMPFESEVFVLAFYDNKTFVLHGK